MRIVIDAGHALFPHWTASKSSAAQFGMTPQHLLEDGDRANARRRLQHRHHLGVENIGKRVRPPPFPRL